jgi:hypothetical protein
MDPKGKFGSPMRQSFHDNAALVGFPTLSSDGNVMFFSIQKGGKTNLYVAKRTGANTWSTPIMLPAVINTENGAESYPQLFRDSLLFFASTGHPGMGGFDIFYTKITVDGEGHAVSGRSDLSKLEFSTPENLGVPINSGADDFSMVLQQNGNGGFFISNRTANGANRNNIYRFNQEPYIFSEPGKDLAPRLPATVETVTVTSETSTTTQPLAVQTAVGRTDTVFIERIVEIPVERIVEVPVEKIVEKEVFISGGDDEQAAIERLKQTDELRREISRLNAQVSQLTERKSQLSNDLTTCQGALAQERTRPAPATPTTTSEIYRVDAPAAAPVHTAPASQPTTSTGIVYRVQVAASRNTPAPGEYRATFAALHRAMPNLRMETVLGVDGYHRYVTVPFATFAEADAVRRRIQALGYQCFVSGYKGNNRVSMSVR